MKFILTYWPKQVKPSSEGYFPVSLSLHVSPPASAYVYYVAEEEDIEQAKQKLKDHLKSLIDAAEYKEEL